MVVTGGGHPEDWRIHAESMMRRQDEARSCYPSGTWAQRWLPFVCTHPVDRLRCVHGDEIVQRGFRRTVCLVCGRGLKGPLLNVCWFTGELHASVEADTVKRGGPVQEP